MTKAMCLALLGVSGMLASASAMATQVTASGTVAQVRSHDSVLVPGDVDWFTLRGPASLGQCTLFSGRVLIRVRQNAHGDRHFALALGAMQSGKTVNITVDDTIKDSAGYCYLKYIEVVP